MKDNILEYKGYYARIEYSSKDAVLFGKIEGIDDLMTFEGDDVRQIVEAFHEAVDDYLLLCEEIGKSPEKPYKGTFNVRIAPELHKEISHRAFKQGVTLNRYVEISLEKSIADNYFNTTRILDKLDQVSERIDRSVLSLWNNKRGSFSNRFKNNNFGGYIECKN